MIRFEKDVLVEGSKYQRGDVVESGDIPAGCLESMLNVKWVSRVAEPEPKATRKPRTRKSKQGE